MTQHPGNRETRKLIIQASFKVFGQKGFGSTTIKDIAQEAEIAVGSIYNYFPDKEALFRETVKSGWTDTLEKFKEIEATSHKIEVKFTQFIDYSFELLEAAHPLLSGMLFGANQRQLVQDNVDKLIDFFETWLLQAEKEGFISAQITGELRRFNIRLLILGLMLQISLTPKNELKSTLSEVKQNILQFFKIEQKD